MIHPVFLYSLTLYLKKKKEKKFKIVTSLFIVRFFSRTKLCKSLHGVLDVEITHFISD